MAWGRNGALAPLRVGIEAPKMCVLVIAQMRKQSSQILKKLIYFSNLHIIYIAYINRNYA